MQGDGAVNKRAVLLQALVAILHALEASAKMSQRNFCTGSRRRATCTPHRIEFSEQMRGQTLQKQGEHTAREQTGRADSQQYHQHNSRSHRHLESALRPSPGARTPSTPSLARPRAGHLQALRLWPPSERSKGQSLYRGEKGFAC